MKPDARIEYEWTSRTDSKLTYRREEISAKAWNKQERDPG